MDTPPALSTLPVRHGKVRDVYDLGSQLLLVASDRISAYDWVLPLPIPDKGRVLTGLSTFWFTRIDQPNHLVSTSVGDIPLPLSPKERDFLDGRIMLARKLDIIPFECVIRGYLSGSGWREYRTDQTVCGIPLPSGLVESDHLPDPIFTPATKAQTGHDENVSFERMAADIGPDLAETLRERSVAIYRDAAAYAATRGLILADTKLEWGVDPATGEIILADEVFTPDSSRYWPLEQYHPGGPQPSFDKQFVRDWLDASGWDKASLPPTLPPDVVARTREKYIQAYEILTGRPFPWTAPCSAT